MSIRTRSAQPSGSRNDWNHKLVIGVDDPWSVAAELDNPVRNSVRFL